MCSHYQALKEAQRLMRHFKVALPDGAVPDDTWPLFQAPFVRRGSDAMGGTREAALGLFGLVPPWADDIKIGRRTYNARSETAAEKPSFRAAWRAGQRCIVPAEAIFEPSWETGKAVPWRIRRADGEPLGIAGLWSRWRGPDGTSVLSFTMLTLNADAHPLMRRFHKPTDEKRMVVALHEADYDAWLDAPPARMMDFMQPFPSEALHAEPGAPVSGPQRELL